VKKAVCKEGGLLNGLVVELGFFKGVQTGEDFAVV